MTCTFIVDIHRHTAERAGHDGEEVVYLPWWHHAVETERTNAWIFVHGSHLKAIDGQMQVNGLDLHLRTGDTRYLSCVERKEEGRRYKPILVMVGRARYLSCVGVYMGCLEMCILGDIYGVLEYVHV